MKICGSAVEDCEALKKVIEQDLGSSHVACLKLDKNHAYRTDLQSSVGLPLRSQETSLLLYTPELCSLDIYECQLIAGCTT